MNIGGVSGSQSYYTSGQVWSSFGSPLECKSVYEADPSVVIRKEEDGIVAKSHYTEEEALWNQYMKQYRDSLKIVDGKLVVNGDPRNALLGKVSGEELEQYRLKLEQTLKEKAIHFTTPMKTSINRDEVSAVYEYTMNQYRQSGDILDAFMKGAKHAQSIFEANFSDRAGSPGRRYIE